MKVQIQDLKQSLEQRNIQYVKVAVTDIDGVLRGKYMHIKKFKKSLDSGFGFCDVIFGWDSSDDLYEFRISDTNKLFTGWHTGYPDQTVRVILDSEREIPFEKDTPLFLCELKDAHVCPITVLKTTLDLLKTIGFQGKSALEYEFFLFKETFFKV